MSVLVDLLVLGLVVGGLVGLLLLVGRAGMRRRAGVAERVQQAGWTYVGVDLQPSLLGRWPGTPFDFWPAQVCDVVVGQWRGRPMVAFEHVHRISRRVPAVSHHVVAVPLPAPVPTLELAYVGPGPGAGYGPAEFHRVWRVDCADEAFAHELLTPRVVQRLLAPDAAGALVRFTGTDVLSIERAPAWPERVAPRLELLADLLDLVPAQVWQRRVGGPAQGW